MKLYKIIAKLLFCYLLGCGFCAYARTPPEKAFRRGAADSSLLKQFHTRFDKFKAIPAESGTDNYYVKLMLALYDGANDMINFQAKNDPGNKQTKRLALLQQYHRQMSGRFPGFLAVGSNETPVDVRFKAMVDAALLHFRKFDQQRQRGPDGLLEAILVEFYENKDQISMAFVSIGQNDRLKQVAWDNIKKQNTLIELLKLK